MIPFCQATEFYPGDIQIPYLGGAAGRQPRTPIDVYSSEELTAVFSGQVAEVDTAAEVLVVAAAVVLVASASVVLVAAAVEIRLNLILA